MIYRLFGLELESDHRFERLVEGTGPPDLCFELEPDAGAERPPALAEPVYRRRLANDAGGEVLTLEPLESGWRMAYAGLAAFDLWPRRIVCRPTAAAREDLVELRLLGPVLSFWLEWQGVVALHAAAVAIAGSGVALLSAAGGKTVLAAALMQRGGELLADDLLAIGHQRPAGQEHGRVLARPAYPCMRMWPAEAERFTGARPPELVHPDSDKRWVEVGTGSFGAFRETAEPLRCIYLLDRREPRDARLKIRIEALSRRDAFLELVKGSFAAPLLEAARLQVGRVDRLVRLVERVPLRRIVYPSGLDRLPAVAGNLLEDLAQL